MLFDLANLPYWLFLGMGIILFGLVIAGGSEDIETEGLGLTPLLLAIDLSILGLTGWFLNVLWGNITGGIPNGLGGLVIFIIATLTGLSSGVLLSRPLGKIFANFGEDVSSDRLIGCTGVVASAAIFSDRLGQVDVRDPNLNLVTITARIPEWATVRPELGEKVMIIDRITDPQPIYLVIAESDYELWMTVNGIGH